MFARSAKWAVVLASGFLMSCQQSQTLGTLRFSDPIPKTQRNFCSHLNLTGVQWPASLGDPEKTSFAIAMNITGSYEGHDGWANLTNDFDGQGMSLGLFQQNLGQGSLQPLLIEMRNDHHEILAAIFAADHLQSLLNMLSDYEKVDAASLSRADIPLLDISELKALGVKEDRSVQWARDNLYVNGKFIPQWAQEFTNLANSPVYVSLQLETAMKYHQRAVEYFEELGFDEVRSYLMLLDIVVQNGKLYEESDIPEFKTFVSENPSVDEKTKLEKLLELRLRHVKPQWVSDVRARKQTIINGKGTVHSSQRDLEKEYCFDRTLSFH